MRRDARALPNWRLANAARRMLAALIHQLTDEMPSIGQRLIADLDATLARQIAGVQLAGISLRSGGAAMSLISTGYEPESGVLARRLIESVLRARAVVDDLSGEHARSWLAGRPQGTAERLAQRYGRDHELRSLSVLAHADTRALNLVAIPPGWTGTHPEDGFFDVRPGRDPRRCGFTLYVVAYELASLSGVLAELFEVTVQLPRWLSDELIAAGKRIPGGTEAG